MPLPDAPCLLITGPPASGKSRAALEHFQATPDCFLVVPTATMAEHLRHQMTRAGGAVRPSRVQTFAQFLEEHTSLAAPPPHLVHRLIHEALERQRPPRFAPLADLDGLHAAIANLFEEAPAGVLPEDLAGLLEHVERELLRRAMALRRARLAEAAQSLWPHLPPAALIIFDGFFTFSGEETRMLAALSRQTRVILTLPDDAASAGTREYLLRSGFLEQRLSETFRAPRPVVFSAATAEREAEEIASRILQAHRAGRAFREIGIVLRAREPYAPLLTATLARFGIPARAYFSDPVDRHPAVAFLLGLLQSLLAGWDHATLLQALRMPASGVGATPPGDRLDFAWREKIPGRGLPLPPAPDVSLAHWTALDAWKRERLLPAEWAARFKSLRALLPLPRVGDGASRLQVEAWRSAAAALAAFGETMDQLAETLDREPLPLGSFCNFARRALALVPLRVSDRRRNVVHIMDVFEARQWELPIVFVCGLIERHFPQYHREDPLLDEAARRKAGLETAASRQTQERSLYEFAVSRASEELILSYPRFDDKGEDTLRSFFLEQNGDPAEGTVRPRPTLAVPAPAPAPIQDHGLLESLAARHTSLSASSIETFVQCPFKFFAQKTLRLHERPPEPRDRLDIRTQGTIMHRVLAEWVRGPLLGVALFDQVFAEACVEFRIPAGYRTEAIRLEMLRNFAAFIEGPLARLPGWQSQTELKFDFAFHPGLGINGRIDRLERNAHGAALVIDYKYSAPERLRERIGKSQEGEAVQAGLYLLAAERQFGLRPAGMLFCALKKGTGWDGWHLPLEGYADAGSTCTADALRELIDTAARSTTEAHERILSGRVAVQPADTKHCRWCDYRDACRIETIAAAQGAGA